MSTQTTPATLAKFCNSCPDRISTHLDDDHTLCVKCRGKECNMDVRCDACDSWSKERMKAYLSHQKGLARRKRHREKKKKKGESSSILFNKANLDKSPQGEDTSSVPGEDPGSLSDDSSTHDVIVSDITEIGTPNVTVRDMIETRVAPYDARFESLDRNVQSLLTMFTNRFGETQSTINVEQQDSTNSTDSNSVDLLTQTDNNQPILQDVFLIPDSPSNNHGITINDPFFQPIASPPFVPMDSLSDLGGGDSDSVTASAPFQNSDAKPCLSTIQYLHSQGILDDTAYIKAIENFRTSRAQTSQRRNQDTLNPVPPQPAPQQSRGPTPQGQHQVPPQHPSESQHSPSPQRPSGSRHSPSPVPFPNFHSPSHNRPSPPQTSVKEEEEAPPHFKLYRCFRGNFPSLPQG